MHAVERDITDSLKFYSEHSSKTISLAITIASQSIGALEQKLIVERLVSALYLIQPHDKHIFRLILHNRASIQFNSSKNSCRNNTCQFNESEVELAVSTVEACDKTDRN